MDDLKDRFSRLENRVDEIRDDLSEVKSDSKIHNLFIAEIKNEIQNHHKTIKQHVIGDNKIIKEIQPLLAALPELKVMIDDHKFEKEKKQRTFYNLKAWSIKLGIIGTVMGIIGAFFKFFYL